MNELDLIRRRAPEAAEPDEDVRTKARERLLAHIATRKAGAAPRAAGAPRRPRRRTVVAVGGAIAIVVAGVLLATQLVGGDAASAAATLRQVAVVAGKQPEQAPLVAGQYLYVKSVNAYLEYMPGEQEYAVLVPATREVWLGEESRLVQSGRGEPQFLSERDRQRWIAAGSRSIGMTTMDTSLGTIKSPELPTDPDALLAALKGQAAGAGHGLDLETFVLVGDNLRETLASSALRAALYEAAARIPGVVLEGETTDSTGRPGVAVSMADHTDHTRHTLIIDPKTSQLLEERDVVVDEGFELGYPAGTVIGYATYLVSTPVANNFDRPTAGE